MGLLGDNEGIKASITEKLIKTHPQHESQQDGPEYPERNESWENRELRLKETHGMDELEVEVADYATNCYHTGYAYLEAGKAGTMDMHDAYDTMDAALDDSKDSMHRIGFYPEPLINILGNLL